jgi:hypothetical protein
MHIHTNLIAAGKNKNDFEDWLKTSNKAKKQKTKGSPKK